MIQTVEKPASERLMENVQLQGFLNPHQKLGHFSSFLVLQLSYLELNTNPAGSGTKKQL